MERQGASTRRNTFHKMLELERRNTLQRMIDLEDNKVNRMSAPSSTDNPLAQNLNSLQGPESKRFPPKPIRSTTMPTLLPLLIPATDARNATLPSTAPADRIGVFLVEENSNELVHDSDESSICHSPAWDDAETKKRRKMKQEAKDKRKKEKERTAKEAAKEAKKSDNPKKRLVKQPPTKKFPKMLTSSGRSTSAPATSMRPEAEVLKEIEQKTTARVSTGGTETGYNSFMQATREIPGPWNAPRPSSFELVPPIKGGDGFIGGLKLRQADEARFKGDPHSVNGPLRRNPTSSSLSGQAIPKNAENQKDQNSSRIVTTTIEMGGKTPLISRHTYQSNTVVGEQAVATDPTPIMERTIKRRNRSRNSSPDFPRPVPENRTASKSQERDHSQRGVSSGSGSLSPSGGSSENGPKTGRPSRRSGPSIDRPPISYREPSVLAAEAVRGRQRSGSYVGHERQKSHDNSIKGFEDEKRVAESTKSRSRGRSWSISSLMSRKSRSKSNTRDSEDHGVAASSDNYHDFLTGSYVSSQRPPTQETIVHPIEPPPVPSRRSSILSPSAASFKKATKGLFSKYQQYSHEKGAYTRHLFSSPTPQAEPKQNLRTRSSNLSSQSNSSKADRILGASVTSLMQNIPETDTASSHHSKTADLSTSSSNIDLSAAILNAPITQEQTPHERESPSRSTTDSCEDFPVETNASTPYASRPQSQRKVHSGQDSVGRKPTTSESNMETKAMLGVIPRDDAASAHEEWSRTAIPLELDDEEERPVTAKNSAPNFSLQNPKNGGQSKAQQDLPLFSKMENGHSPQPNLRKTDSFPEATDLSFLPELKHQSLERPEKRKDRREVPSTQKISTQFTEKEKIAQTLVRPPPPSPPSSASPPNSPLSGQYLRTARLALPPSSTSTPSLKRPSFPRLSSSSPSHTSTNATTGTSALLPHATLAPVAKMFVICCSCRYFHDMPSKIYECMARPDNVVEDKDLGVRGLISSAVRCPWCTHGMTTACCEGWAAVVLMKERLH